MRVAAILMVALGLGSVQASAGERWRDRDTDFMVERYAANYGVRIGQARHQLSIQEQAGKLQQILAIKEKGNFAGLYIERFPRFKIVVKFVRQPRQTLSRYTNNPIFSPEPAVYSLAELVEAQAAVGKELSANGIEFESGIDLRASKVNVGVDANMAAAAFKSDSGGILSFRHQDAFVELTEYVSGGDYLKGAESKCTAGFSVINAAGVKGLVTAGHCSDALKTTILTPLSLKAQKNEGSYDVQWNYGPKAVPLPEVRTDKGKFLVRGTMPTTLLVVGAAICKYGRSTFYDCGEVADLYAQTMYEGKVGAYVRVRSPQGLSMSLAGDSGGPVFVGNYAAGIIHGRGADGSPYSNDMYYMPIENISILGISVMRAPE